MSKAEGLQDYGLTFFFEDGTRPRYVELVVQEVVRDRYVEVEDLGVQEMGGTTHLAFFEAEGKRLQKSVFDSTRKEVRARIHALFHILNEF